MSHVKNRGFTLVELMLAMTFISILLLAIALTILQISQIYNKGLTTKEVNVAARIISDNLSRDVASSEAFSLDSSSYRAFSDGGRLCLGKYSYVWNYGKAINAESKEATYSTYTTDHDDLGEIRLVRVPDVGGVYCAGDADNPIDPADSVELIGETDHNIAIHAFSITSSDDAHDEATGERLYVVSFVVGTNDTAALTDDGTQCRPPSDANSDLTYCAVSQFTIVLRAQNAVN